MTENQGIGSKRLSKSEEDIMNNLIHQFGTLLDFDIIEQVAYNCNYDEILVITKLQEMLDDSSPNHAPEPAAASAEAQYINGFTKPVSNNNYSVSPRESDEWHDPTQLSKLLSTLDLHKTKANGCTKKPTSVYKDLKPQPSAESVSKEPRINHATTKPNNSVKIISKEEQELNRIILDIQKGYKIVVIMRGLPGSGKSTLAKKIVNKGVGRCDYHKFIISADDYFIDHRTGAYEYHPSKIKAAHDSAQDKTKRSMAKGVSPLVIDNTNTQIWEMKAYVSLAVDYGYVIEIVEPLTSWKFNCSELSVRNTHNVPRVKIREMCERYDKHVSPNQLLMIYGLSYYTKVPSQRNYPPILSQESTHSTAYINNFTEEPLLSTNQSLNNAVNILDSPNTKLTLNTLMYQTGSQLAASNKQKVPHLNLAAWGLAENSLNSWEVVSPLRASPNSTLNQFPLDVEQKPKARQTADITTNTSSLDFQAVNQNWNNLTIITAKNRDINNGIVSNAPRSLPKKILLDKGSMTDENVYSDVNFNYDPIQESNFEELVVLFSEIPAVYLRDVYEKCKRDLNWAVNILLDDNKQFLPIRDIENNRELQTIDDIAMEMDDVSSPPPLEEPTVIDTNVNLEKPPAEDLASLKKHLESQVVINKDYYSPHVSKLKSQRDGSTLPNFDLTRIDEPSTSSESLTSPDDFEMIPEFEREQETMELNLGSNLVAQLEAKFGSLDMISQGFQPLIQIPVHLAEQIHALYVDSIFVQMENEKEVLEMIAKEDEEFAKKLQLDEVASATPNLKQIMEEQLVCQQQTDEWRKLTPDTLAAKLTMQKLMQLFPRVPQSFIEEILCAHNNSYQETVEVLSNSVPSNQINDPEGTMSQPPITKSTIDEMKSAQLESENCINTSEERRSPQEYRGEATIHLEKHKELIDQARQCLQKKQYAVAQFYSEMAKYHTSLYDQANSMAVSAFLEQHSTRLQKCNILDLHYLYVKEALAALDVYLDRNIMLLKDSPKRYAELCVITGRGKNSANGISKLRPAVQGRLRKRKIPFTLGNNPGVLNIRISFNSLVTSDLE